MSNPTKVYPVILSVLLIGVGIAGDLVASIVILENHIVAGMALHLIALSIWSVGLIGVGVPASRHNGPFVAAIVLGTLLFPGLGTLGYTLGWGLAHFMGRHGHRTENAQEESLSTPDMLAEIGAAVSASSHPLVEAEVQPLVDVLHKPDLEAKRAALDLICREPGARALSLARALLADPDSGMCALAAVAVSRLETHFNELLRTALARQESQPQVAEHQAATGYLYYQYAQVEPDGSANRHFYLAQARQSFEKAVSLNGARSDYLTALAEVLIDLGEEQLAGNIAVRALAANPEDCTGYLLRMEIAFQQRKFDEVAALAERACRMVPEHDEALPTIKWWGGFSSHYKAGNHDG